MLKKENKIYADTISLLTDSQYKNQSLQLQLEQTELSVVLALVDDRQQTIPTLAEHHLGTDSAAVVDAEAACHFGE